MQGAVYMRVLVPRHHLPWCSNLVLRLKCQARSKRHTRDGFVSKQVLPFVAHMAVNSRISSGEVSLSNRLETMAAQSILTSFLALVLVICVRGLLCRWQLREKERQWGCRRPIQYPHWLPWGVDLFWVRMQAVKAGRLNQVNAELFSSHGATYEEYSFGDRSINTREVENIQTIAALRFEDYGKSDSRTNSLLPFLGRGIFSEDGAAWKGSRDLVKPLFKRAEFSDLDGFRQHADRFFNLIPRDGSSVDLQPLLGKLVCFGGAT